MANQIITVLILLLVGSWVAVAFIRAMMGKKFKKIDAASKDELMVLEKTNMRQGQYLDKNAEDEKLRQKQDEDDRRVEQGEHLYPTQTTKKEYLERKYRVGEEKENIYPERK